MAAIILSTVPRERDPYRISPTVEVFPNIGLCYVAAALKAAGHDVLCLDPAAEGVAIADFARQVAEKKPLFIGFSCYTLDMTHLGIFSATLKQLAPDITIVAGGTHPSALPVQTMEEFPDVDYIIAGEGEVTSVEFAEALLGNRPMDDVAGVLFRRDNEIIRNRPREQIADLDSIPFPDYSTMPLGSYSAFFRWPGSSVLPIHSSRGCPYACTFCYRTHGRSMRYRGTENIMAEIRHNIREYGRTRFCFTDETFTANRRHALELCQKIIDEGLHEKIEWMAETRVDLLDGELARVMRKAGCRYLHLGVESGDEATLRLVRKQIVIKSAAAAVRECREAGIETITNWIFGHPHETEEKIRTTIRAALEINSTYAQFLLMVPYPGTEIYDMALKGEGGYRLLSRTWSDYGKVMQIALELKEVPKKRLMALQRTAYRRFYLRPGRFLKLLEVAGTLNLIKYAWFVFMGTVRGIFGREPQSS